MELHFRRVDFFCLALLCAVVCALRLLSFDLIGMKTNSICPHAALQGDMQQIVYQYENLPSIHAIDVKPSLCLFKKLFGPNSKQCTIKSIRSIIVSLSGWIQNKFMYKFKMTE